MRTVYGFDDEEVVTGDGLISVDSDIEGVEKVTGSRSFVRDPRLTAPGFDKPIRGIYVAPHQMCQLALGTRWCSCCADVRPEAYFDVLPDGKRDNWCKSCRNDHTPWLRPTKYCSGCKTEKARSEFGGDMRNVDHLQSRCKDCEAARSRTRYRERVGRDVRSYAYRDN